MEVKKLQDSYQVTVVNKITVIAGDEIQVKPEDLSLRGHLRGLCGDFGEAAAYELTGPNECVYSDAELFKYAWTSTEGPGCKAQEVQQKKQSVHQFQENCKKHPPSGLSSSELKLRYG